MNPESSNELNALYQAIAQIRSRLESYSKEQKIIAIEQPVIPPSLRRLSDRFNLSPFESEILLLCAGMELDPQFPQLCAAAAQNPQANAPTFALALSLFPDARWEALSAQSPLQHWQLIRISPHATLTQAPLSLDRRIFSYLLNIPDRDRELKGWMRPVTEDPLPLPLSYEAIAAEAIETWSQATKCLPILQLCGKDADSQLNIAKTICDRLGFNLYSLEAAILPIHPGELEQLQHRWQREALLGHHVLWIEGELPSHSERCVSLHRFLINLQTPAILSRRDRQYLPRCSTITLEVSPLSHAEKQHLWELHLGETAAELNGHLEPLIAQFNLNPRTIQAASASIQNNRENVPERLWQFCRQQARPRLEHLAQRIETTATWDDLVLPLKEKNILRDLAAQVRQRAMVCEKWGFARKSNRGLGISALFAGASGTGKTMAAEVLAREFNLDLYRIDLSAVTSKYIGETEKNLAQIFDAAEAGGVVLLFDEADALFGKRTQVKDSHDRHANIEVSYLLQRMEAYQGLAVLTTNFKDNLDQAFLRRLRFIVNFPFPKADARKDIWQQIFPEQTPTQSLNFRCLGQLNVAGGNIRAIALNAAFIAAESKEPVAMHHILQATRSEYLKIGRSLTSTETQGWI